MTRHFASSLRFKVAIGVALPVFVMLAAVSGVQYLRERQILLNQLEGMAVHLGQVMRGSLRHAMLTRDLDEQNQTLADISRLETVQRVAIFDGGGRLRAADSFAEFDPPPSRADPGCAECHQPGGVLRLHSIMLSLPGREPVLRSSTLIPNEPACHDCHNPTQQYLGVLIADFSLRDLEREAAANLQTSLGLSALATVLITAGVYGLIHSLVVRRVERFGRPLRRFAQGDFSPRVPVEPKKGDELGELAGAVNRMAEGLGQQAELERRARQQAIAEERRRLARELHDGVAQMLAYFNTKTMAIRLLLGQDQKEQASEQLEQLEEASRSLFDDIRQAIHDLKTTVDGERGFVEALRECSRRCHEQSGIQVSVELAEGVRPQVALAAEVELQLLRIVQEALANVRKHAGASRAWICLEPDGERGAALTIADDGRGFDPTPPRRRSNGHYGLSTMRERAEGIGGTLAIASKPGEGTRVTVKFPLREGGAEGNGHDNARVGG